MRRSALAFCLIVATGPAFAAGHRSNPKPSPSGTEMSLIEHKAALQQVTDDAFQQRILAAEERATASICAGCLSSAVTHPVRRRVAHAPAKPTSRTVGHLALAPVVD